MTLFGERVPVRKSFWAARLLHAFYKLRKFIIFFKLKNIQPMHSFSILAKEKKRKEKKT